MNQSKKKPVNRLELVQMIFETVNWSDLYIADLPGDAKAIGVWDSYEKHKAGHVESWGIVEQESIFRFYTTSVIEKNIIRSPNPALYNKLSECCSNLVHHILDGVIQEFLEEADLETMEEQNSDK